MMNWEIGIDMQTLMCIKWMTNKNLLYKKRNKIKFIKKKKNLPANAGDTGSIPAGKILHAAKHLSPCATTTEPMCHNY